MAHYFVNHFKSSQVISEEITSRACLPINQSLGVDVRPIMQARHHHPLHHTALFQYSQLISPVVSSQTKFTNGVTDVQESFFQLHRLT